MSCNEEVKKLQKLSEVKKKQCPNLIKKKMRKWEKNEKSSIIKKFSKIENRMKINIFTNWKTF